MDYNRFLRLLRSSKAYEFTEDGILEITDYYTGERVALDLSQISEETFEDIQIEEDEE